MAATSTGFKQRYYAICKRLAESPHEALLGKEASDQTECVSSVPVPRWTKDGSGERNELQHTDVEREQTAAPFYDWTPKVDLTLTSDLTESVADCLAAALATSVGVHNLTIRCCRLSARTATAIAKAISMVPGGPFTSLSVEDLTHPLPTPRGVWCAVPFLNSSLKRLSFSGAGLTAADCTILRLALSLNTSLRVLILSHNPGICDEGVVALCEGLREHRSLEQLSLACTGITDACLPELGAAISTFRLSGAAAVARAALEAAAGAATDPSLWPFASLLAPPDDADSQQALADATAAAQQLEVLVAEVTAKEAPSVATPPATTGGGKQKPTAAGKAKAADGAAAVASRAPHTPAAAVPLRQLQLLQSPEPSERGPGAATSSSTTTTAIGSKKIASGPPAKGCKQAAPSAATAVYDPDRTYLGEGCTSLRVLDLCGNQGITPAGLTALAAALGALSVANEAADHADAAAPRSPAAPLFRSGLGVLLVAGCSVIPRHPITGAMMGVTPEAARDHPVTDRVAASTSAGTAEQQDAAVAVAYFRAVAILAAAGVQVATRADIIP